MIDNNNNNKNSNENNKGILVVFTGASGVGKGTVMKKLLAADKNNWLSVSMTTRAPRENEVAGVDYNYISVEKFKIMMENREFLESACYCENYYGSPKAPVEENLKNGKNVFLEIEVQGFEQVRELYPDCVSIFLLPPSIEILEQRLRGRGTEPEEVIKKRLNTALGEIARSGEYKYNVVNDDIDKAVEEILNIVNNERMR